MVYEPGATTDGERLLLVSGVITDTDDIAKFAAAVKRNKATVVEFDSPGGDIYKAMELGRKIRELGLDTFQTRGLQCASACSLAFLGGVSRSAAANAIGVHRPYYPNGFPGDVDDAVVATQQATADMIGYIIDMGVDPALVQLSYEYTDMRYLTRGRDEALPGDDFRRANARRQGGAGGFQRRSRKCHCPRRRYSCRQR